MSVLDDNLAAGHPGLLDSGSNMGPEAESRRGTSEPVWVRRSTFVVRVGGGTKADRHWLCRGNTTMLEEGERFKPVAE